jgi:uncharacterized protein
MSNNPPFRKALQDFIHREARPVDKYGHQPRLYTLARKAGAGQKYDDDVVFAAAWLHDLGVFAGHRPEDPEALAKWDNVAYAVCHAPSILSRLHFPEEKIPAVLQAIRTHQPQAKPSAIEGVILRDADILEQLGAIGILRMVSKVGRDTRYPTFTAALEVVRRNLAELPGKLRLPAARALAEPKIRAMEAFLAAVDQEAQESLF